VFAHAVNQFLYPKLTFDMTRDFVPVIVFSAVGNMLMVHPSIPAQSVKELVAVAKRPVSGLAFCLPFSKSSLVTY
jgi:tripartite-type tricarboxylate transporter receptor subunit TctC